MNASMPSSIQPAHAAQNPLIWFALSFVLVLTCVVAGAAVNAMAVGPRVYGRCPQSSSAIMTHVITVLLLVVSNTFMTSAWYGHLRYRSIPIVTAILVSWLI